MIKFFKKCVVLGRTGNTNFRYDMAELQMRLKQFEKAEKTIQLALRAEALNSTDINSMLAEAKLLNLLSKVCNRYSTPFHLNFDK